MAQQFHTDGEGKLIYDETIDIMVKSKSELDRYKNDPSVKPGSVAYTAGFKNMWHLSEERELMDSRLQLRRTAGKWKGLIFGLDIRFEAEMEEAAVERFHQIADEHMPEPD